MNVEPDENISPKAIVHVVPVKKIMAVTKKCFKLYHALWANDVSFSSSSICKQDIKNYKCKSK